MALTNLWLELPSSLFASRSAAANTIDADGEKHAAVFSAPISGDIRTIVFRTGAVVQDTNGLTVGIEGVDASGDPDGSAYGGSAVGTTAAVSANTIYTVTLGTDATVTAGDKIAAVIEFTTFAASDDVDIQSGNTAWHTARIRAPYVNNFVAAAWAKQSAAHPLMAIGYSDGSYYPIAGMLPPNGLSSDVINTGTTPDEVALRFQLPVGARCVGVGALLDVDVLDDFDFVLYSGEQGVDEVTEQTISVDGAQIAAISAGQVYAYFPAPETLAADTWYKVAVKPSTANSVIVYSVDPGIAAVMDALPLGQNAYFTSRADGAAWTNDTTKRAGIWIIVDQVETGAAGGLLVHGGMTGGING